MAGYRLSHDAERDFEEIYAYTIETFGLAQARAYGTGLQDQLALVAAHPRIGRRYDEVQEGLHRFEYERHSIYYRLSDDGILVLRLLHQRMDPARHL